MEGSRSLSGKREVVMLGPELGAATPDPLPARTPLKIVGEIILLLLVKRADIGSSLLYGIVRIRLDSF